MAQDVLASEILVSPEIPREADVVTFTVVLRNTGREDAGAVSVMTEWPLMGFLVGVEGLDAPTIDHEARRIEATVPLKAGAEARVAVRVLAPRDSGGDTLTLAMRAAHYASGTEHWDRRSIAVDTRPSTTGVVMGGLRFTPASFGVLAVLLFGVVLWMALAALSRGRRGAVRRGGSGAAAMALTIAVGFWAVFGAMAWRDSRSLTTWREATCTVLGGRLSAQATTSRVRPSGTDGRRDDTSYVPVLGLRYQVDGRETFSSGYDTGSRLGIGGRGGRQAELDQWAVGATTPCWYDPDDPLDVVVLRGFGGAYLFALFPVPVFLYGVRQARRLVGR